MDKVHPPVPPESIKGVLTAEAYIKLLPGEQPAKLAEPSNHKPR